MKKIQKEKTDSIEKSKKLYRLLAYEKALKILDRLEVNSKPSLKSQVRYYQARCYNELGMKKISIEKHMKNITENPGSQFARLSNRRVYIIASRLGKKNIKKLAINVNKIYRDKALNKILKSESNKTLNNISVDNIEKIKIDYKVIKQIEKISTSIIDARYIGKNVRISNN